MGTENEPRVPAGSPEGGQWTTDLQHLLVERNKLREALSDAPRGGFPGSREWKIEHDAMKKLDDFDKAHPEVVEQIRAQEEARAKRNAERFLRSD